MVMFSLLAEENAGHKSFAVELLDAGGEIEVRPS